MPEAKCDCQTGGRLWPQIVGVQRPAATDDMGGGAWQQMKEAKSQPKG